MDEVVPVIAIDGPGGAGKGTVAKFVAAELGWHLLDSGMLYRLLALASLNHHIDPEDEASLAATASALDVQFVPDQGDGGIRALLEGEDVTDIVRTEEVGAVASKVAAIAAVRSNLLERQRAFVAPPGLVADGRDMGTVVFREAPLKIFLTASVEERAERRYKQLLEKGQSDTLARLAKAISERDRHDMERPVAPLKAAPDAIHIDSTRLTVEAVCSQVIAAAQEQGLLKT